MVNELAVLHGIEDVLLCLELSDKKKAKFTENFPLNELNKMEAIGILPEFDVVRDDSIACGTFFDIDNAKINHGILMASDRAESKYIAQHISRVKPKDVRGKVDTIPEYLLRNRILFITPKLEVFKETLYLGSNDGYKWCDIGRKRVNGQQRNFSNSDYWSTRIQLLSGAIFEQDYYWYVDIGYQGQMELSFVTTPEGSKEIFRLRDIPNGRERRAALRNWVESHWRKSKIDQTESIKVREHLRGAIEFDWNGLHVRIRPSTEDLKRNTPA